MRRLWLLLLPLALVATGAAPRLNIPSLGEVVDVSIVNVDVFVTDKQGHRVRGLTKDDFEITQDRKPQPISNFAEYGPEVDDAHVTADGIAAAAAAPPTQKRTLIFFIDRFTLASFDRDKFFSGMKALIHKTVRPGDAAMIAVWRAGLQVREPFTDDLERLDDTMDGLAKEAAQPVVDHFVENTNEQADYDAWVQEVKGMGADASAFASEGRRPGLELSLLQALYEIKQKVAAINAMMATISGAEGKKVLFLATHRLGEFAGADFVYGSGGNPATDVDFRARYSTSNLIGTITRNANANGITVYPFFPEGLKSDAIPRADTPQSVSPAYDSQVMSNETPTLAFIAKETGGLMAWGTENIVNLLPTVQDDFDSYYSLAYRVTTTNNDGARAIVVKTKNPQYVVRARRQFVEKSDEAQMNDRVIANLFQKGTPALIALNVKAGAAVHKHDRRFTIPVEVHIPIAALTTVAQAGTNAGAFSVYMTWGTHFGTTGDVVHKTQTYTIAPSEMARAKAGVFTYDFDLLVDENTTQLSVGVFDEVSREYGLARIDLPPHERKVSEAR
jgi:VWFA-related protein